MERLKKQPEQEKPRKERNLLHEQEKPRKERNLLHEQEKPRKERNLLHCSHTHNLVTTCISPFLFVFVVSMVLKQPPPPPPH